MKFLLREVARSFHKHFFQFLGLIFFVAAATLTFTALFTSVYQIKGQLNQLNNNSGSYSFQVNVQELVGKNNNNITPDSKLATFLSQFYPDWSQKDNKGLNTLANDARQWTCQKTPAGINQCTPPTSITPPQSEIDAYSSLILNFNDNVNAALLDYLFNENNNYDINFVQSFQFISNINSYNQYFLAENIYNQNIYFNSSADKWVNNNIYQGNKNFNVPFDFYHYNKIKMVNDKTVYVAHQFANNNNLRVGDSLQLFSFAENNPEIAGWGYRSSDINPNLAGISALVNGDDISYKNGSQIYINNQLFQELVSNYASGAQKITGYIKNNTGVNNVLATQQVSDIMNQGFISSDDQITDFDSSLNGQVVLLVNDNFILDFAIASACSIVIIIILSFFIKKDINNQQQQIGVLKALGYEKRKLAFLFVLNIFFSIIFSCIIGWALSVPLQIYITNFNISNLGLNLSSFYFNLSILLIVIIGVPIIFFVFAYLIAIIMLNKSALILIYNLKTNNSLIPRYKIFSNKPKKAPWVGFKTRLSFSFATRSFGKWLVTLVVLSFSSFLLFFQFDAGLMANNVINNSFRYFNNDIKSYLVTSYDNSESFNLQNNSTTTTVYYNWESVNQAKINYTPAQVLNDPSKFNFPDPKTCFADLATGQSGSSACGDLLNIIGTPADGSSSVIPSKIQKDTYVSSEEFKSIVNYQVCNKDNTCKDGWKDIIDDINNSQSLSKLKPLIPFIKLIDSFPKFANGSYPKIYFGPNMIYDSNYDFPYVVKAARWSANDIKVKNSPITSLKIVGLPQDESVRNQFFNFSSENLTSSELQNEVFKNINFSNKKVNNNEAVPVILSSKLYKYIDAKPNMKLTLNIKINSTVGYSPVSFIIKGSDDNDITSNNIYLNEQQVAKILNNKLNSSFFKVNKNVNNVANAVASKINKEGELIMPYRLLSVFSLNTKDSDPYNMTIFPLSKNSFTNYRNLTVLDNYNKVIPFDLLRASYKKEMTSLVKILNVLEALTIFIVTLILAVLITMVLDENKKIILTMKVIGYSLSEIVTTVLGFYTIAIILGYFISYGLSYGVWKLILGFIFAKTALLLSVPFSVSIIFLTIAIVLLIIIVCLFLGIWKVKKNKLTYINLQ